MTATASTTIAGVSVLTEGERPGDPFDIALSAIGIEIRRPGSKPRRMSWSRVSEWALEERRDDVVLTLRGDGAATPLRITGWSLDDLETLLRTVTSGTVAAPGAADTAAPASDRPRHRRGRRPRVGGKSVLIVVLLVVLATAVTLVLLQSAGVIDWGFLGPTA